MAKRTQYLVTTILNSGYAYVGRGYYHWTTTARDARRFSLAEARAEIARILSNHPEARLVARPVTGGPAATRAC